MATRKVLLLGFGNHGCGDDGLGPALADAVNADGRHGTWRYEMVREVTEIPKVLGRG